MKITIIAAGNKMPAWVVENSNEYIKRLPKDCDVKLIEVPITKRAKNISTGILKKKDTEKILSMVPSNSFVIAMDERGDAITTKQLSDKLIQWQSNSQNLCFLIGGPDGFDYSVSSQLKRQWPDWTFSLSNLTLPHPIVRVILVEQIYRAWSVLSGHPYHRE